MAGESGKKGKKGNWDFSKKENPSNPDHYFYVNGIIYWGMLLLVKSIAP